MFLLFFKHEYAYCYFCFYIQYVTPQGWASSLNREPFVNRFNILFRIEVLYSVSSIVVVML